MTGMTEIKPAIADFFKFFGWAVVFIRIHIWVLQAITIYDVKEVTRASYDAYVNSMMTMVWIAAGLTVIWWLISRLPFKGREFVESNAWIYAVISVLLYFCIFIFSQYFIPGVIREGGTLIPLHYGFIYPCAYTALLYILPPNNVCRIIIPFKWVLRFPIGLIFAVIVFKSIF